MKALFITLGSVTFYGTTDKKKYMYKTIRIISITLCGFMFIFLHFLCLKNINYVLHHKNFKHDFRSIQNGRCYCTSKDYYLNKNICTISQKVFRFYYFKYTHRQVTIMVLLQIILKLFMSFGCVV